jgi:hypothetical protein
LPASSIWCCRTLASSTPGPIPSTPASPTNYEDVVSDLAANGGALWAAWEDACLAFYQTRRVVRTSSDPGPPTAVSLRDRTPAPALAPFGRVVADARLRTGSTRLSANDQIFAVVRGHMTIAFKWRRGRARPRSSPSVMPVQQCMRVPAQTADPHVG